MCVHVSVFMSVCARVCVCVCVCVCSDISSPCGCDACAHSPDPLLSLAPLIAGSPSIPPKSDLQILRAFYHVSSACFFHGRANTA